MHPLLVHNGTKSFRDKLATEATSPERRPAMTMTIPAHEPVSKRKRVGVVFSASILMLGGGVAWAAWTNSGTGAANAQATTATGLVVTAGTPSSTLYPKPADGYSDPSIGAVYTTVANPNPYPVQVTTVSFGAVTITPLSGRSCPVGSVVPTSSTPTVVATPITLAANASATAVTIPGAVEMISTAEDGCQGASFSVPVTLTGASA